MKTKSVKFLGLVTVLSLAIGVLYYVSEFDNSSIRETQHQAPALPITNDSLPNSKIAVSEVAEVGLKVKTEARAPRLSEELMQRYNAGTGMRALVHYAR